MHVLKVFSGTKTQFLCNKDSFFLDVADEVTATMHLDEIAEVRDVCYIDECCDDLLFTHNDDVWYRENTKHSFFFFLLRICEDVTVTTVWAIWCDTGEHELT